MGTMAMFADGDLAETLRRRTYWFNEGRLAYRQGNASDDGMPEYGRCNAAEARYFRAGYFAADAGFPDIEILPTCAASV
ncbi:hypothetical protein [Luteibacter sp. E-22]|uniref:hypothetical protein n=1 Tax=Luteibacter sp. E-22 TaxID=3404050 RepID=UPI003CFA180D